MVALVLAPVAGAAGPETSVQMPAAGELVSSRARCGLRRTRMRALVRMLHQFRSDGQFQVVLAVACAAWRATGTGGTS